MSAHTPGPWESDARGASVVSRGVPSEVPKGVLRRTYGYGCGPDFVCRLNDGEYCEYSDEAEQVANAHLIAAAPDLLAALKRLSVRRLKDGPCWCFGGPLHDEDCREAREAVAKAEGKP